MDSARSVPIPSIRTLLLCDLVESTRLVERIGDAAAAELLARHDHLARELLASFEGREIDKSDGFLLLFERPIQAVRFAVAYQASLRDLGDPSRTPLAARVGIHLGEVLVHENPPQDVERGAKPLEVEGLSKAIAARVMSLAGAGRILLTRAAFDLARRSAIGAREAPLRWMAHGRYRLSGVEDLVEVFEVAEPGEGVLSPPTGSEKARRADDEETIIGWRPAPGVEVPRRNNWRLARKLGEGGFGETWLAEHQGTRESRVFKFCYDAVSLRALRREITLFRLLKETLGDRRDITRVLDWNLEEAPYFIESEYSAAGSLPDWAREQGGIGAVPFAQRLDLVAQVAEALAAAHSVGVIHKDVKPANVLIQVEPPGSPRAQLADFGIGLLLDRSRLTQAGITFRTELVDPALSSSGGGTLAYLAPELLEGKPVTLQADVYALGVLLFQMAAGDLSHVMAPGWERDVSDDLLREDIASMVDGNPQRRPASALVVAERLRTLEQRRAQRDAELRAKAEAEANKLALARSRRRRRQLAIAAGLSLAFAGVTGLLALRVRSEAERANREAASAQRVADFLVGLFEVSDPSASRGNTVTAREILDRGAEDLERELAEDPAIRSRLLGTLGVVYQKLGLYDRAKELLERALEVGEWAPADDAQRLRWLHELASTHWYTADYDAAERLYAEVIERRTRTLGADHPDTLLAMSDQASTYLNQERFPEAEALAQTVLASSRKTPLARDVALEVIVSTHLYAGRLDQAERAARRWVALDIESLGEDHPTTGLALRMLAQVCNEKGESAEAETLLRRVLAIMVPELGEAHRHVLLVRLDLSDALLGLGRVVESERLLREVLAGEAPIYGAGSDTIARDRWKLACVLLMLDQREEARALMRENRKHGQAGWTKRTFWRSRCDPLFAADPELSEILRQLGPAPDAQ